MSQTMRRQVLLDRMQNLAAQRLNCENCSGKCCTYEANSMMVTPVEVMDLHGFLKEKGLLTSELKAKVQDTVAHFRLDRQVGNGKRSFIRRNYTCPFFNHRELGCPFPPEIKPYGCLAFNAHHPSEKGGEFCHSEKEILEGRESREEQGLNERLKEKFKLYWEKLPMPVALLEVWDLEASAGDLSPD